MKPYIILVEFNVKPEAAARFRELILHNARMSLQEPGCRQFDVLNTRGDDCRFVLYEIYDHLEAFKEHTRTTHFLDFDRAAAGLVVNKNVSELVQAA